MTAQDQLRFSVWCAVDGRMRTVTGLQQARETMHGHRALHPDHHVWVTRVGRPKQAILSIPAAAELYRPSTRRR
jgi:hypothetical protein